MRMGVPGRHDPQEGRTERKREGPEGLGKKRTLEGEAPVPGTDISVSSVFTRLVSRL